MRRTSFLLLATGLLLVCSLPTGDAAAARLAPPVGSVWSAGPDYRLYPDQQNPSADRLGNPGVWRYLHGATAHRPGTYQLLTDFQRPSLYGGEGWFTEAGGYEYWGVGQGPPPGDTKFITHPGPANPSVLAWRSPFTGRVKITGYVQDADPICGDGVRWSVDKGASILSKGAVANGGSQTLDTAGSNPAALRSVRVKKGDVLYLLVLPGPSDNCDRTHVRFKLTRQA